MTKRTSYLLIPDMKPSLFTWLCVLVCYVRKELFDYSIGHRSVASIVSINLFLFVTRPCLSINLTYSRKTLVLAFDRTLVCQFTLTCRMSLTTFASTDEDP